MSGQLVPLAPVLTQKKKAKKAAIASSILIKVSAQPRQDATQLVQAFRGAVSDFWVGHTAYLAHGPLLVRMLQELAGVRLLIDARLQGTCQQVQTALSELVSPRVQGITVRAAPGDYEALRCAIDTVGRYAHIIAVLPSPLYEPDWSSQYSSRVSSASLFASVLREARKCGAYGALVPVDLVYSLRQASKRFPLFSECSRGPEDYRLYSPQPDLRNSPDDLHRMGVTHTLFDPLLCGADDMEHAADCLYRYLNPVPPRTEES